MEEIKPVNPDIEKTLKILEASKEKSLERNGESHFSQNGKSYRTRT